MTVNSKKPAKYPKNSQKHNTNRKTLIKLTSPLFSFYRLELPAPTRGICSHKEARGNRMSSIQAEQIDSGS
jgi:hypothetical protein